MPECECVYIRKFIHAHASTVTYGTLRNTNMLKLHMSACCQHCIKVTTNDHVLPSMCVHLITFYHNYIICFVN